MIVTALLGAGAWVVMRVTSGAVQAVREFEPEKILAVGNDLKQDEFGYTNLVLLGDGGHERDGADLIDTIMVASVDFKKKTVSLLSIPRDFYVWSEKYGDSKINEIYRNNKKELGEVEAYTAFREVAGQVANLEIQYYARVDFNAFVEVVDSLGGITVNVEKDLYDPYYPNESDDGYTVFQVQAGIQEMNGETALKYVRSRKTTSDFDRAARQQQVLMAIKEKATVGNLLNPKTIKNLYGSISRNVNTDMSLKEMVAMASLLRGFDRNQMVMKVIHDDPSQDGGFLYTPERKYFNGQFVLVPDGVDLDMIHKYADLIFHQRDVLMNPVNIEVLNATKKPGVAREVMSHLNRYGFKVVNVDNFYGATGERKYVERSFIRYNRWEADSNGSVITPDQQTLDALAGFVKGEPIPNTELDGETDIAISIVLGEDNEMY